MKKMKKCNKGFTLTELAIVIAVIAILIAVLVPTFVSLINNANESSDVVTVRNMNTVLSTETDDIDKPTDALKIVYEEGGYSVANMTPKSNGKIVYDELTSSFVFVYSDGTTYPENVTTKLDAYTTWELVSTSDIEPDADGAYHFDESEEYKYNSIILKGSDWAGKTVYASYGVELWNDNDTSTTLSGLYIKNTDTQAQITADAGSVSLAKTAIKTAGVLDSTRNIIVNVKTNYLSYAADVYNISDHSTVNTLLSTGGSATYYQYGTTNGYDITNNGSAKVVVCNEEQAEKINNSEVAVIKTDDVKTSVCITSDADIITVDMDDEEVVATIVVASSTETLQITVTEEAVTITISNTTTEEVSQEIVVGSTTSSTTSTTTFDSLVNYQTTATTSGLGTSKYPYLVYSLSELTEKIASDCCIQLMNDIECSTAISIDANITLDLNGHSISAGTTSTIKLGYNSTASLTVKNKNNSAEGIISNTGTAYTPAIYVYSKGTLTLESGKIESYYNAIKMNGGATYINGGTVAISENATAVTNAIDFYSSNTTKKTENYLTINGGKIIGGTYGSTSTAITTGSKCICIVEINGGEISGKRGIYFNAVSGVASTLEINDGTITTDGMSVCLVATGTVTLNGGSITSSEGSAVTTSTASSAGKFIINGGTIKGYTYAVNNASSNTNVVEINGGTLIGDTAGVSLNSSSTVTGGQYSDTSASENVTAGYILSSEVNSKGYYEVTEEVTE